MVDGGKHNEYKARLLNTKYKQYTMYFCNRTSSDVKYRQFTRKFSEISHNIKSLEVHRRKTGDFTVSKQVWSNLSFEDKYAHLLMNCDGCMKKANYRKVLAKLSMRDKNLQQKTAKSGLYWDGVVFTG